jgi:hypothetical protein
MTQIAAIPPLTGSVTVEVPIERAFQEALRKGISETAEAGVRCSNSSPRRHSSTRTAPALSNQYAGQR